MLISPSCVQETGSGTDYSYQTSTELTRLRSVLAVPKVEKIIPAVWKTRLTAAELAECGAVPGTGGDVVEMITAAHLVTEIADLRKDLLAAMSEAELEARIAPGVTGV